MKELTVSNIPDYLISKNIFDEGTELEVIDLFEAKESVEGFVNLIFQATDKKNGRSVVIKQVAPHATRIESNVRMEIDVARLKNEISVLIFWNSLTPDITPEIYLFDEEDNVIAMEDLTHLSLVRFEFIRMKKFENFGKRMGEFFAHNLFCTSKLSLTKYKHKSVENFFHNVAGMTLLGPVFDTNIISTFLRPMNPPLQKIRENFIRNKKIQDKIKFYKYDFENNKECLIHTDLHTSNIMINDEHVKIIDTEFAIFGPIAQDFGRLYGSLITNYLSWYGVHDDDQAKIKDFQEYILSTIEIIYNSFTKEFTEIWNTSIKENYRLKRIDLDEYLHNKLQDILAYTAINASSRLAELALPPDLKRLSVEDRKLPMELILSASEKMLCPDRPFNTIYDFTDMLKNLK
jgi:5-methylthioribose kinase